MKCGAQRASTTRFCAQCQKRRTLKFAIGSVIAVEAAMASLFLATHPGFGGFGAWRSSGPVHIEDVAAADGAPAARGATGEIVQGNGVQVTARPHNGAAGWLFYNTADVAGDLVRHARLVSNPPVTANGAPLADGVTAGTLELAASAHSGRSVTVSFPLIRSACDRKACSVHAIFDETQPMNFSFSDQSNDQSTVLRLHEYDRFMQRMAVSHDLTIVAALGAARAAVLNFSVDGYSKTQSAQLHLKSARVVMVASN